MNLKQLIKKYKDELKILEEEIKKLERDGKTKSKLEFDIDIYPNICTMKGLEKQLNKFIKNLKQVEENVQSEIKEFEEALDELVEEFSESVDEEIKKQKLKIEELEKLVKEQANALQERNVEIEILLKKGNE